MEHHFNEVKPIDYNRLFNGIRSFKTNEYILHKQLFEELRDVQNPHTLFIGCSDSRVVPSLLTRTLPGELFVVRNIGNFVPYFNNKIDAFLATSSVIEYAVLKLKVDVIVVCGHSNCGGCDALYHEEDMEDLPFTRKWLQLAKPIKKIIEDKIEKMRLPCNSAVFSLSK